MSIVYRLRLLGHVQAERDGIPVSGFVSRKALALLGYLAWQKEPVSRSHLAYLFWPDKSEARGRGNLSRVLNNLLSLLPGCLWADYHAVQFQRSPNYWLDIDALEKLVGQARIEALREAMNLYRDDFMTGIRLKDCPEFEIWLEAEREQWRRRISQMLNKLIRHYSDLRQYEPALQFACRLLKLEPWREETHQTIILLLARSGQRGAALSQYKTCRRLLAEELGVEPARETTALYERIRAMESQRGHNLQAQPTPLVGRETELKEIIKLIYNPDCRLLTLVGLGGIGKTRLALEAAFQIVNDNLINFLNGVYFVSLASVSSADLIAIAIANSLQLSLDGARDPQIQLLNYLQDKEILLIVDNFEHLLEGTNLLVAILQRAPEVKIVVTSRLRLSLRWEWVLEIQGLAVPEVNDFNTPPEIRSLDKSEELKILQENYSAIRLFSQVARRIEASFSFSDGDWPFMARICQLVEGMPLGIELAAVWVEVYSCAVIARQIEQSLDFLTTSLRDMPTRHSSLRIVFDYSWSFLSAVEKRVFRRLSVFRGGFQSEAAEQVAGASSSVLSSLVSKSFLRLSSSGRFEIHELLRHYGAEKLKKTPQEYEHTQNRHCAYYAAFLQQREISKGRKQKDDLAEIEIELDNVRVGWQWAIEHRRLEDLEKAMKGLWGFYEIKGWFQEGEDAFRQAGTKLEKIERSTNSPPDSADTKEEVNRVLGPILGRQAWFCWRLGNYVKAKELLQKSLDILDATERATPREIGFSLYQLGHLNWHTGEYAEAKSFLRESLAIGREVNDRFIITQSLLILGLIAQSLGEYAQAELLP